MEGHAPTQPATLHSPTHGARIAQGLCGTRWVPRAQSVLCSALSKLLKGREQSPDPREKRATVGEKRSSGFENERAASQAMRAPLEAEKGQRRQTLPWSLQIERAPPTA